MTKKYMYSNKFDLNGWHSISVPIDMPINKAIKYWGVKKENINSLKTITDVTNKIIELNIDKNEILQNNRSYWMLLDN